MERRRLLVGDLRGGGELPCVLPWKALATDDTGGRPVALPCCAAWIRASYGEIGERPLEELWNAEGAQQIRALMTVGRHAEICEPHCPHLQSGQFAESKLRVLPGPAASVENQKLNNEEIRARQTVLASVPSVVKLVTTTRCNLRCIMCFQDHKEGRGRGTELWAYARKNLAFFHELILQGGEISVAPEFRTFLADAVVRASPHTRISFLTNGTGLDAELLTLLRGVSVGTVVVSLNAATEETYERITGQPRFHEVVGNVRALSRLARSTPPPAFSVMISMVVMGCNFREIPSFIDLAQDLGVGVQLHPGVGHDNDDERSFCGGGRRPELLDVIRRALPTALDPVRAELERLEHVAAASP